MDRTALRALHFRGPSTSHRLGSRKFGNAVEYEYRTGRGLAFGTGLLQVRRLTDAEHRTGMGKATSAGMRRAGVCSLTAQFFSRTRWTRWSIGNQRLSRPVRSDFVLVPARKLCSHVSLAPGTEHRNACAPLVGMSHAHERPAPIVYRQWN